MAERAKGRCEVSGIPFNFKKREGKRRRPWVPSIDRIVAGGPYSFENCRLVCSGVNYAMNEWGPELLMFLAIRLRANK
jgi:hypothetical protein